MTTSGRPKTSWGRATGQAAARRVRKRYWRPRLEAMSGPLRDAKTELQEWAHRRGLDTPTYNEVLRFGPDHAPEFEIESEHFADEQGLADMLALTVHSHHAASAPAFRLHTVEAAVTTDIEHGFVR